MGGPVQSSVGPWVGGLGREGGEITLPGSHLSTQGCPDQEEWGEREGGRRERLKEVVRWGRGGREGEE